MVPLAARLSVQKICDEAHPPIWSAEFGVITVAVFRHVDVVVLFLAITELIGTVDALPPLHGASLRNI